MWPRDLLADQVAIVAGGGGGGIGASVSRTLAGAGAAVTVVDIESARAESMAREIEGQGGRALPVAADLRDREAADGIVESTRRAFGRVDLLVNVAGGMHAHARWQELARWEDEEWDAIVSLNLRYVFLLCRAFVRVLRAQGTGGSIVNVTSISGVFGAPNHSAYGAAKAGLIHLTKTLAVENGRHGIRCNAVSPGIVETPATADALSDEQRERLLSSNPLGRTGRPDDIANAVVFFSSPLAAYVNGQMLLVDGGVSCRFPLPLPGGHPSESL